MAIAAVVSLVLVLVGCVWAHVAAFRFFAARHTKTLAGRLAVGAFFGTMFVGPLLLRALPRTEITGLVSRIGTLWHLFVLLAALPYGVYAMVRWVTSRRAKTLPRAEPALVASAVGSPVVAEPAVVAEEAPAEPARRRALETTLALGGAAVSASVFGYASLIARTDWEVVEVLIKLARLPRALDGFTIIQVSDIHVGNLTPASHVRAPIDLANSVAPDVVALTGDYVCWRKHEVGLLREQLGGLRATRVAATLGNHA